MLLSIFIIFILLIIFIFINPDQLKPLITTQVEKYTGYKLSIDEHLSFAFIPCFSVKIHHMQMMTPNESSAPSMKLDVKNAVLELKLIPLLQGKFKTGSVQIDQLTLNQAHSTSTIQLNNIRLKSLVFDQLANSFLTDVSFDFIENSLPLSGHVALSGKVAINRKNGVYYINNVSSNVSMNNNNKTLDLTARGEMMIDIMHQTASWKNINASLSNLTINGELNAINILSYPSISGHLTLQSPTIKKLFEQIGLLNQQSEHYLDIGYSIAKVDLFANNESFDIQSNIYVKNASISNINIDDANFRLHFKNNNLIIKFINANLYGGYLNGEATINLESPLPIITAHVKTHSIQIEPIFKLIKANTDIHPSTKILGTGDVELAVSIRGADEKSFLNNVNGKSYVSITNGTLMGNDWDDIVAKFFSSNNTITQEMMPKSFSLFRFKQLSGSFTINNGVLFCDDLLLKSSDLIIKGKGNINLPNNTIDYELQAELQNPLEYEAMYNNPPKIIPATVYFRRSFATAR